MLLAGPAVGGSLFLPWSHQFSRSFEALFGRSAALQGVPRSPTAWQVYSIADVLLALLAAALIGVALRGTRTARLWLVPSLAVALAFTAHAAAVPPTNGADIFDATLSRYASPAPQSGSGEAVALIGLGIGMCGALFSLTVP